MNFAARLYQYNGRLFSKANAFRLQPMNLRDFNTQSSLHASMRNRMDRIRRQTVNRTPFMRSQTVCMSFMLSVFSIDLT